MLEFSPWEMQATSTPVSDDSQEQIKVLPCQRSAWESKSIGIPNRAWVKGYGQEGGDKKQLSKMTATSVDGSSLLAS